MHQHWWVVLLQDDGVQTHSDEGPCFGAATATVGGGGAAAVAVDSTSGSGGDEGMG